MPKVGGCNQQGRQFALGTRGRLQRHRFETGDLGKHALQIPEQLQNALESRFRLTGMEVEQARQRREPLVASRVVLHRATAEWIEVGIDRHVELRKIGEMPDDIEFRQLRNRRRGRRQFLRGHDIGWERLRNVERTESHSATTAPRELTQQIGGGGVPHAREVSCAREDAKRSPVCRRRS